jgi:hypothetical protein
MRSWLTRVCIRTSLLSLCLTAALANDAQAGSEQCRDRWVYAFDTYRFVPTVVQAGSHLTVEYRIEDWFIPGSPSTPPIVRGYYITTQVDTGPFAYYATKLPGMTGTLGTEPVKGEMGVVGIPTGDHRVIIELWESLTESHPIAYLSLCLRVPGDRRIEHFELDTSGADAGGPLPK